MNSTEIFNGGDSIIKADLFRPLFTNSVKMCKFLMTLNPNIDWNDVIEKMRGKDDLQILNLFKSKLWIDKNIDHETFMRNNVKYFGKYTNLLNKFAIPLLQVKKAYVLGLSSKAEDVLGDEMISEVYDKISVLSRLLKMMDIECQVIDDSFEKMDDIGILITTGSISYNDPCKMIPNKCCVIIDDFNNTITDDCSKEVCLMKLMILDAIGTDPDDLESILRNRKYGLLDLSELFG